jgi:uncharacterized protein
MKHKQFGNKFIIRIDKDEEIIETLKFFCRENKIALGMVSGIGAAEKITLGYFKTDTLEYVAHEFAGSHEITSLSGNITQKDGEVYLHLHANIANIENQTFGGHLSAATISATFEVVVEKIDGTAGRKFNDEIGLNLLDI